jgi:hypothetical protein
MAGHSPEVLADELSASRMPVHLLEAEMCQRQPRCPDVRAPDHQAARAVASPATHRARENSEYVRRTLGEKQPEFAALLESLEAELACPVCRAADAGGVSALRGT